MDALIAQPPEACAATAQELDEAVLTAVLDLESEAAREMFLQRWFKDDAAGLARMRRLARAAVEATEFFLEAGDERAALAEEAVEALEPPAAPEEPGADAARPVEGPGSLIGRYRLLERLGEGGCGVVYLAEQVEPVRRRVALKIIRLGMDTEAVIARFELERQALAMMDHPHIARVLDAGATEFGRPYFVMERVGGQRLTTFYDERQLDLPARLALFIQVCQAIQHAHQKGIVHRDLKPSNILVEAPEGVPVPKVIDFGIAKAAGARAHGRKTITGRDQIIGTPAYMSPEQVDLRGVDIDTRSDIYSLGMVLYELLAGRAPFEGVAPAAAGLSETRRSILEHEPPPPSRWLAHTAAAARADIAARRGADPARLVSLLRGDLDAIVLKAIEKDRNRRYQTTNSLAMDVQRFLAHEPVLARRPGRWYFMGKFLRRNRFACAAGAAVAVSLLGGMASSTWLFWRERKALAEQVRLAREAEAARAEEDRLRAQAEARASISQVAGLINRGRVGGRFSSSHDFAGMEALLNKGQGEAAEALLRSHPLDGIDPSPDAARVFRSLGHWHALRGRWEPALGYFLRLHQANRFDSPEGIIEGNDPMCLAALLVEHGTPEAYEGFRREILDRHLPARSAFAAEHVLKISLLRPADEALLERLRPVMEMCASGARSDYSGRDSHPQWDALAITMYYHRRGDAMKVVEWSEKCLAFPGDRSDRHCSARSLRAMALWQLGETELMEQDLTAVRALLPPPPDPQIDPSLKINTWLDEVVARLMWQETVQTIGHGAPPARE